jgi:hypothetical protein
MKAVLIMFAYSTALLIGGLLAYGMAPEGSKAITAIIVPVGCAVVMDLCAFLAMQIRTNRRLGMIGIHAGLVFTLLFAIMIGARAYATTKQVANYPAASAAYAEAVKADRGLAEPQNRKAFFKGQNAADHDKTYLRNNLWALSAAGFLAFAAMLAMRPKPAQRGATEGMKPARADAE